MTIEQEEFDLQQAKEELNNIDYMFPYADPEYKEMARKAAQRRVDVLQLRVNRKKNIALTTELQNEAMYDEAKAKKLEKRADNYLSPSSSFEAITNAAANTVGAGADLASNLFVGLPSYLTRAAGRLTDSKTVEKLGEWGMGLNRRIKDRKRDVALDLASGNLSSAYNSFVNDDRQYIPEEDSSYFEGVGGNKWDSIGNAAENIAGGVGRFTEGYMEFAPLSVGLGAVSSGIGKIGSGLKASNKAIKAANVATNLGIFAGSNVADTSDYIEQQSGEFRPGKAALSSGYSAIAMELAFAIGRGMGMNDTEAYNYATRMLTENGFAMLGKKALKQGLTTAALNGVFHGGVGSGLRELVSFKDPSNPTEKEINRLVEKAWDGFKHEFVQGGFFGTLGAVNYHRDVSKMFNELGGKSRKTIKVMENGKMVDKEVSAFKHNASAQIIRKTADETMSKEAFNNLFKTGTYEDIKSYLDSISENISPKLNIKDSAEMQAAKDIYDFSVWYQWGNSKIGQMEQLQKNRIKSINVANPLDIQIVLSPMKQRLYDMKTRFEYLNHLSEDLDKTIESKDSTLKQKQEAAQQKEEVLVKKAEVMRDVEKPYTRAEVIEAVRDMVARKRANDPETLNRVNELLSRFLLKDRGTKPIDVDDAVALLIEVDAELNKIISPKFKEGYNGNIEDIISPKLIGSDVIYGRDERNIPSSVIPTDYTEPRQIGYDGVVYGNDERNMPTSALPDNTQPQSVLPSPQGTPLLEYKPTGRKQMPISEGSNQPINNMDVGSKVNRESPSSFGVVNNVPSSVNMMEKPIDSIGSRPKTSSVVGKKIEIPTNRLKKSEKAEALQTKGVEVEKGELKDRDMPMAISKPSSEPMAVKKESAPKPNMSEKPTGSKKTTTEKSSATKKPVIENKTYGLEDSIEYDGKKNIKELVDSLSDSNKLVLSGKTDGKNASYEISKKGSKKKITVSKDVYDYAKGLEDKKAESTDDGFNGFLKGKQPFEKGAAKKALNKVTKYDGKTVKEVIDQLAKEGTLATEVDTSKKGVKTFLVGASDKEGRYRFGGYFKGKTVYQYAEYMKSRMKKNNAPTEVREDADSSAPSAPRKTLSWEQRQEEAAKEIWGEDEPIGNKTVDDTSVSSTRLGGGRIKNYDVVYDSIPRIGDSYDRESRDIPAPVEAMMNLTRGGEWFADLEHEVLSGIPDNAIALIESLRKRIPLVYEKKFADKVINNLNKLEKMVESGDFKRGKIKPISLEELEAQPIKRMPQEDVESWREGRELYVADKRGTEPSKQSKREYADIARNVAELYREGKITKEQRKYFYDNLKPEYDFNLDVDLKKLEDYQKEIVSREREKLRSSEAFLVQSLNKGLISFNDFVERRRKLSIDYHDSLWKSGILTNGIRRQIVDPNRYKPQLSRTKNKATSPVTDKELNNFLRGQAKQISKETGLNFKVVDSVDELRKMFPNNDITDTVEGGIHNDTVYLVRGNIDKDRLPLVIAHEVAGHRGVESLFENKQQMDNFFNSLERAAAKDKFIRDAFAEVDRLGYKENRSREAMAKIVEKVRNESGTLKGTAKTFVNFITSRVRRLLRRMGFKNLQLSEAEVYDIAVQALRRTGLKNSNKFFGLDRFLAKDNSFLSATSTELDQKYPGWQNQTNDSGGHTTQIKATVNTYKKIGEWIKNNMKGAKILDASSGLGEGTEALKQMGLNIEDVEPYASNKRKNAPIYDSYDKIKGKYDAIISNAVLNVIPDNWRSELLHNMADKLNDGGKLFINVRDAKEVSGQKQKIELDSPSEILVTNGKGGYRAYQKGFTQPELESWVKKELGSGYKVEKANEKNSGMPSGSRAIVITKEGGNGGKRTNPRYEEITKQLNAKQLGNREFNNKATELGALKTLQGTKIERYKKTVGKEVSGQVYVHKNYANEVIPNEILDKAKKILSEKNPSFRYNTLMWDKNKGIIRFDEAPNFDTAPEPIPGKMLSVNPITREVKEAYSDKIWHHKWQWVKNDYKGFDTKESWERSREWLNGLANLGFEKDNPDYSISNNGVANGRASGYDAWNKQLKYYGLDHLIDDKNNTVPKADIQFSIGERKPRKVKPDVVSEAEKKILDEIGEVKNPRDYNAVKKIAKNRMAEYKDVFSTKKNTGYKTSALKLHYLLGFDRKTQSVEKAFQSIRDFNTLQKTASAYARSIIGDKSTQANILDNIVKAKTFEKVYDIISKTNIAKEREIRKDLLDDFRNTIKELNPKKISTPTRMYTDEILGESFTPEELDSLIHSNEFTTKAVGKLRNIADNLASELGNIRNSDIEVSDYAINNAARLKHELNEIIKQRDAGNGAMNVPVEKLAEVNQLLKRFVNQDKLYKESLDTSAKNAAVADREQILSESPEKNPKTVNSRETNSIGRFKEYFLPGKALKTQDNENVAATMGKTMHKVAYEDLLEGQNRQDHYRATGYKGVDRIMESFGKDLEDGREYLDKTAFKVKTSEGHEYEITNNEALAIIANYLDRETGQMIKKAGKVNFYLGEKKDSDYFTFTRKELDDMVNKLTPKQKKAIEDGFALLSNDFLPELNRVYEKLNGVPLRLIQGRYFPRMHVDVTQSGSNGLITRDRAPYIHQQMNADYQGILKQRDAMATPNLNLRGFTDTLQNYTDQASLYIGMAEPLRHLNRIMNGQMKRELTARYGAEYVNRINQMIGLMAGMAGKTEVDKGFATRYLSNLAAAKLTPLSAIKQLTSVPLASSVIPAEYLAKAAISGMSNENVKEMMELDGMVLRYRSNGIAGIIPVNAKTWGRERIQGEKFKGQKLIDKAVGVGLNLSLMADKRALGIIYKATKLWAESQGKGSDKAWIENKFMEAVRRTQNTTDLASATGWQMDSRESGTMAFLNMYLNQTQKVSNEFFRNKRLMDEAAKKYGKNSAQYKEARNRTATFAASAALMEAMMLAIGSGASMLFKGKDEDSIKDKAVTAVSDLTGNPLLKPMINAYSLQGVLKGKKPTNAAVFGDDFSGMIPEITYTMGRVMNDLQSDDPAARKFRKLSYDMLSSKAAETSLALGRVPTWFARYPAKFIKRIWGEDLKNTRQKPSTSSSSGSSRLFSGKRMFGNSRTFGGKRMF